MATRLLYAGRREDVLEIDGHLAFARVRECVVCGENFRAIKKGRRGPFPKTCDPCRAPKIRTCEVCGTAVGGRALYCQSSACQRVRKTKKQLRWEAKPETKEHISKYRRAKRAAKKA